MSGFDSSSLQFALLLQDRALLETDAFGEAWERAARESVRSGDLKPHAQDIILQAQDWGFKLSDIRPKPAKKSFFKRILSYFGGSEQPGFSGPIHIFHVRQLFHHLFIVNFLNNSIGERMV